MLVTVRDAGTPQKSAIATLRVNVLRNAHKPVFVRPQYTVNINETLPSGSTILTVTATDADAKDQPEVLYYF